MKRVRMMIYEDENWSPTDDEMNLLEEWSDEPLFSNDEEIATQAYRLLRNYKQLEKQSIPDQA